MWLATHAARTLPAVFLASVRYLQAIQAHGGFYEVSKRLGWKMDFQPRSQMSLQQLRHAFDEFAAAEGLQAAALPSSRLLGAKRPDLQKEADKWGGLAELAELWEYSLVRFLPALSPCKPGRRRAAHRNRAGPLGATEHVHTLGLQATNSSQISAEDRCASGKFLLHLVEPKACLS